MQARPVIIFFFVIALLCKGVSAQVTATYTITGEEISPEILVLKKHSKGYILAGTANGLYRFDSHDFVPYTINKEVKSHAVTAIGEDKKGVVWLGFQSGEIGFLKNNVVQLLKAGEGHPAVSITGIVADTSGIVYFTTAGEGIYYYNTNNRFYNINTDDGLSDNYVYDLLIKDYNVLAITDRGINSIDMNPGKIKITTFTSSEGLPDNIVRCIYPFNNLQSNSVNKYWIGMQEKGVGIYYSGKDEQKFKHFKGWHFGQVNSLIKSANQLWAATDSGLMIIDTHDKISDSIINIRKVSQGNLKTNNLVADDEGNTWYTSKEKLFRTNGTRLQNIIPFSEKMFAQGHVLLADRAGNFWVNTTNSLKRFFYNHTSHTWHLTQYLSDIINAKTDITTLYEDMFGNLWIGTMGKGIYVLDPVTGKRRHLTEDSTLINGNVLSIAGKGREIWISGLGGIVHCTLSDANNDISKMYALVHFKNIGGIGSNYIYSVFVDSKDRVWFATDGKGLSVLDKGKFINYNQANGIKSLVIYNVCEDLKGNIWFSALNDGLYTFDGKGFTNISIDQGLNDATITALAIDSKNNIIAISRNGLNIINSVTHAISYIDKNQGISKVNTDLNCISVLNNSIYFISNNGIEKYEPATEYNNPVVEIDAVKVFEKEINISLTGTFAYDENNFTFQYSGVSFSHSEKVIYQYKIDDGGNSAWITTKNNSVNIPKLPPGKYIFRVKASLNASFAGSRETTYSFTIKKPVWLQWWFILLNILLLAGTLYLYIRAREKRLKRLERLEKEKIKSQLETLKSQVNPHFLFNSFNTLISVIEDNQELAVEYVEHLSDFYRKIVTYRNKDLIPLEEELEIINDYLFIQKKRFNKNLHFICNISAQDKSRCCVAPLTLQLLMENAIKHNAISSETPLTIEIYVNDQSVIIKNNINPKLTKETSAGSGLQNIKNRYRLLSNNEVIIEHSIHHFIVTIPLLKPIL